MHSYEAGSAVLFNEHLVIATLEDHDPERVLTPMVSLHRLVLGKPSEVCSRPAVEGGLKLVQPAAEG